MLSLLEKFYNKLLSKNEEHFNKNNNNKAELFLPMFLALLTTQLLLLLLGKFLWNNFLVAKIGGIKKLDSIFELFAISLLLRLLIG